MGQVGACADNAAMESFFSLLQKNVLDRQRWQTRAELRLAIVVRIEKTYHRRRAKTPSDADPHRARDTDPDRSRGLTHLPAGSTRPWAAPNGPSDRPIAVDGRGFDVAPFECRNVRAVHPAGIPLQTTGFPERNAVEPVALGLAVYPHSGE